MRRNHVSSGLDNLRTVHDQLSGKRVGLMTHPCGYNSSLESGIDILNREYHLTALFGCEHGIRGDVQAGETVQTDIDPDTGVQVYSLYGATRSPTPEMLDAIDVFVVDLQDVGARFYTYLYSLSYAMIACAKAHKPVIVLDRINPLGGERVLGTLLDERFHSFVGEYAIPTRYALTIGEYARFVQAHLQLDLELTVARLTGWTRAMYLDDTDALWTPPSPNMPTLESALLYTGTCIFEGTNLSEGRGTTTPFELIGAPFIDGARLEKRMRARQIPGVGFRRTSFTPTFSKWAGEVCRGVELYVTDRDRCETFAAGLMLLDEIRDMYPRDAKFLGDDDHALAGINLLLGTDEYRTGKLDASGIIQKHQPLIENFRRESEKYHLYP